MKTYNLSINDRPSSEELREFLGVRFYEAYKDLCETIEALLKPDIEKWDDAGRRGKYYHGYATKNLLIDFYLIKNELIKCEFDMPKRYFTKLLKQKNNLSLEVRKDIEKIFNSSDAKNNFSIILNNKLVFTDIKKIIEILSVGNVPTLVIS